MDQKEPSPRFETLWISGIAIITVLIVVPGSIMLINHFTGSNIGIKEIFPFLNIDSQLLPMTILTSFSEQIFASNISSP